jgi:hypothetical protein
MISYFFASAILVVLIGVQLSDAKAQSPMVSYFFLKFLHIDFILDLNVVVIALIVYLGQ